MINNEPLNLGKPQCIADATEKIWLTGLLHNSLLVDKGVIEKSPDAPKQHLLKIQGTNYLIRRLGSANDVEVSDHSIVAEYVCTRNKLLEPTHILFSDSLEYIYMLILRSSSSPKEMQVSHFIKVGAIASVMKLLEAGVKLKPLVFSALSTPGSAKTYALDISYRKAIVKNSNGVLLLGLEDRT